MIDLQAYRSWFYAAAIYNFGWGTLVGLFPKLPFNVLHIPLPTYLPLMQCIGMIVGVYGLGYWLIAVDPVRYGPFVWIGLAGKILGPLGFIWAAYNGELPWSFGWINVTNDLIWLPAFVPFALAVWRNERTKAA